MLKKLSYYIFVLLILTLGACKPQASIVEVPIITHDTTYISTERVDSIKMYDSIYIREKDDTVYLFKYKYIDKYKFVKDTVYKCKIDTIPVIHTVEVEKRLPFYDRIVLKIGRWFIPLVIIIILICVILLYIKQKIF